MEKRLSPAEIFPTDVETKENDMKLTIAAILIALTSTGAMADQPQDNPEMRNDARMRWAAEGMLNPVSRPMAEVVQDAVLEWQANNY